jgi:hypothetical protein
MDVVSQFQNLLGVNNKALTTALSLPSNISLLQDLYLADLFDKVSSLFEKYYSAYSVNMLVGSIKLFHLRKPPFRELNDIVWSIKILCKCDDAHYQLIFYLSVIATLYQILIDDKDFDLYTVNFSLSHLIDLQSLYNLIAFIMCQLAPKLLIKRLDKKLPEDKLINDYIKLKNLRIDFGLQPQTYPEGGAFQLLHNLRSNIINNLEKEYTPGGIGAKESEDLYDLRNGALTEQCNNQSYDQLQNMALALLNKSSLSKLCSVITEFKELFELNAPCDTYTMDDLKDIISQLIYQVAKRKLCKLIQLLS